MLRWLAQDDFDDAVVEDPDQETVRGREKKLMAIPSFPQSLAAQTGGGGSQEAIHTIAAVANRTGT